MAATCPNNHSRLWCVVLVIKSWTPSWPPDTLLPDVAIIPVNHDSSSNIASYKNDGAGRQVFRAKVFSSIVSVSTTSALLAVISL